MGHLTWSLYIVTVLLSGTTYINFISIFNTDTNYEAVNSTNFSVLMISLPIILLDYLV